MSDNCDACRERAIRRLLWYCSRVVWRRRSYSGHQTRLSEDLNEPGCQLRLVWGTRHAAVMYHTVQGRIQEFCMKVRRWIPLLWRWNRFCLCTTKTEANLFHTVKNSSIYFSKFVPFLLILGKWQTSHEGTSIVGLTVTKKTQKRPDRDLQDRDWQGKITSQNILPSVPTAIEFRLGMDRRFVDLRMWGELMTSHRGIYCIPEQ